MSNLGSGPQEAFLDFVRFILQKVCPRRTTEEETRSRSSSSCKDD